MTFLIFKVIFLICAVVGTSFLIPVSVAVFCKEYSVLPSFIIPLAVSWILGLVFVLFGGKKKKKVTLSIRASFAVVAVAWITVGLYGAIPFLISGSIPRVVDAVFESVSGFSTTGATILNDVEALPRSINLWRCLSHWLGGMGIVALTVALMPVLGVGGFQLIKAETTGPEKGKFTSRITTTAKILWFIYFGMTVVHALLLKFAGMDWIDSLSHAFSTLGTGGFSTKNASIGHYNSAAIDWICTLFMFFSGVNFTLYYYMFTREISEIKTNTEFKAYIGISLISVLLVTFLQAGYFGGFFKSLRYSAFTVASILTTTGYGVSDYTFWLPASQCILFTLFFIGGSSGSTSGGVKVIRWVILSKQLKNELLKILHPHGIFSIRLNQRAGRKDVVYSVAAYFFLYAIFVLITTFVGAIARMDIFTAFTGAISMVGNVGPGFNALGPSNNCAWLCDGVKWWYCLAMIAGRLELFTLFIFLIPDYWRK